MAKKDKKEDVKDEVNETAPADEAPAETAPVNEAPAPAPSKPAKEKRQIGIVDGKPIYEK